MSKDQISNNLQQNTKIWFKIVELNEETFQPMISEYKPGIIQNIQIEDDIIKSVITIRENEFSDIVVIGFSDVNQLWIYSDMREGENNEEDRIIQCDSVDNGDNNRILITDMEVYIYNIYIYIYIEYIIQENKETD